MAEQSTGDVKLVQYLNEAYGKEKELEVALQAHIAMTTKPPYKKRLQQHLKETKQHAKSVERRIKQLGGSTDSALPASVADAASGITAVASKAVAAAQGPLHALRGTGEAEKMLKNARTEFHNEFAEIGFYTGIEAFADSVGDKETAKLARGIRREEERMAKFLEKQIPQLAKAVAREEVPAAERRNGRSSSRRTSSARRSSSSSRSSSGGSTTRKSSSRSSSARKTTARSKAGSTARKSTASARKRTSSARKSTASARKSSGSTRGKSGSSRTASRSRSSR